MARIITALNVALNALFSDYVFSTFLSSPLTIETLYKENKGTVMKYLYLASSLSLLFGLVLSILFQNWTGIATAIAMVTVIDLVYLYALR